MSDLNNLFTTQKQPTLSKRLFTDNSNQSRQRSMQPLKNTHRQTAPTIRTTLSHSQLPKRTLSKQHLKKELKLYNNQILVCLVRKVFFIMVAILLFNFLVTDFNRPLLYSNTFLAISLLKLHFESDILGSKYFPFLSLVVQLWAYGLNFYYLLAQISNKSSFPSIFTLLIVSISASINYLWTILVQPIVKIKEVKNVRTPYLGLVDKISFELKAYFEELKTYYELIRPLICFNLAYWLCVVCYIIKNQQQSLFSNLFNFDLLRSSISSGIMVHLFLRMVTIIDIKMGIQLLSGNKKEINLNLLRMSEQCSGKNVHWEIQKYIWSSCQFFWDTDFLTRHYQINYDLLEDYMTRQIEKTESSVRKCLQWHENRSEGKEQQTELNAAIMSKYDYMVEYYQLLQLLFQLKGKLYLFYIMDQIALFEKMGTTCPISMDKIHKSVCKLVRSLNSLQQRVRVGEVRVCLFQLSVFLEQTVQLQE